MKKIYFSIICLLFTSTAFCQDTLTSYFDAHWVLTSVDNAIYIRKKIKSEKGWNVTEYYKSGQAEMKGLFSDDSLKKRQGLFVWYNDKGTMIHESNFTDGKSDGAEIYYYANGQKQMEGFNKNDKNDGNWTAYYESGKISGTARYKDGRQIAAKFYNEDGSPNDKATLFMRESEFPGGIGALGEYLSSHLKYPAKAIKNNIQGTVIVEFVVDKDGSVSDIKVIKSVDLLLDEEAVRVIKKMPKWDPAIQGGRLVKSYKRQPIEFKFQ
jgi:TonB family protein